MLTLEKFKQIKSRMTNEGLKGDQHQLDHDKDGKIEGEDFAKLRAKKMKKEETSLEEATIKVGDTVVYNKNKTAEVTSQ